MRSTSVVVPSTAPSSAMPPRCAQRRKSSAQSLLMRRASSAQTSVATGHVVISLADGLAFSHASTGACQRSAPLKSAMSGPLSTSTGPA
ncbi:MAG: hypothetical protein U1F25_03530 [Rubrivivax sp.]